MPNSTSSERIGRITLLLQGGGALGAYQGGVYQALHEHCLEPDWLIGTSIGAINASFIAGNALEDRLPALSAFWRRIEFPNILSPWAALASPLPGNGYHTPETLAAYTSGIPGFYQPNVEGFLPEASPREKAALFSTAPLRKTLHELVRLPCLNSNAPRLTIGATNVKTGVMCYFDSRHTRLGIEHIAASGALPPSFPAVEIDGTEYWDGGVVSNTPIERVFDDRERHSGLVFSVNLWNRRGESPGSVLQSWNRLKEIQQASRTEVHIAREKQMHKLRHVIVEMADCIPEERRNDKFFKGLLPYGCTTIMHVVELQAPPIEREAESKDIDFSAEAINARWRAGYEQTIRMIERAPWLDPHDPLEGVILHEIDAAGRVVTC
jgi:NTE family protein